MPILVFGQTGQVATELSRFPDIICIGRDVADLSHPERCAEIITQRAPSAVINAAAYTAVDKAESEEDLANAINGQAPGAMAKACAALDIPMVHISTDYVFEGNGTAAWAPSDKVAPLGAYGRSKLLGEQAIAASGARFVILRTSWVVSAHGNNFIKTMLRLGSDRDALSIVSDQIGGPTPARAIAKACMRIAQTMVQDQNAGGIYHFSGAPDTSWADFARAIFQQADLTCDVSDILTKDYPTPASRPLNSRMDCASLERDFGIARPSWQNGLTEVLQDLAAE